MAPCLKLGALGPLVVTALLLAGAEARAEDRYALELTSGERIVGELADASPTEIVLIVDGKERTFNRARVRSLVHIEAPRRPALPTPTASPAAPIPRGNARPGADPAEKRVPESQGAAHATPRPIPSTRAAAIANLAQGARSWRGTRAGAARAELVRIAASGTADERAGFAEALRLEANVGRGKALLEAASIPGLGDPILAAVVHDLDPTVPYALRKAAIRTLEAIGGPGPEAALCDAMAHAAWGLRVDALDALARLGTPRALAAVEGALGEDSPRISARALEVFREWLADPRRVDLVRRALAPHAPTAIQDEKARERLLALIATAPGEETRDMLRTALDDPSPRCAAVAARALGRLGARDAIPVLERLVDATDPLGLAAAESLTHMGDRKGFDALLARTRDQGTSEAAWAALRAALDVPLANDPALWRFYFAHRFEGTR